MADSCAWGPCGLKGLNPVEAFVIETFSPFNPVTFEVHFEAPRAEHLNFKYRNLK